MRPSDSGGGSGLAPSQGGAGELAQHDARDTLRRRTGILAACEPLRRAVRARSD